MNTNDIIKIASKLPFDDRANIAFDLMLQDKSELASKLKSTVPFENIQQRHSKFVERMDSQYLLLFQYSGEYWKQKSNFFSSLTALQDFDIHEDNEQASQFRDLRLESCQRLIALNVVPETLERKHGILSTSITHQIDGCQIFQEINHPIEWLGRIWDFHDEYTSIFEQCIAKE